MNKTRKRASKDVEAQVAMASRRRCCLCFFLRHDHEVKQGQMAHLNGNPSDSRYENLAFLCFEHHNEYDSRTSQSKGLLESEVRGWRDRLYARFPVPELTATAASVSTAELAPLPDSSELDLLRSRYSKETAFLDEPWRFSLWQVANQAELFAYKARGSDGVCLIERIDLPDGRIVVVCIQIPGNPGTSITNAVEDICLQVCERFEIPPARLIWLEHYDRFGADEWNMVAFERIPPQGLFESPRWTKMTPRLWEGLLLRPKKALRVYAGQYESKVKKLFAWPAESD